MKKLAVPLAIGLSLSILSAPVMAKSTIGGIVFLNTYADQFEDTNDNANDVDNFILANAGNSRFRVKWTNEDRVTMYQELAVRSSGGVSVRHAYGKWDFSETGQILAGQTSTPFAPLNATVAMVHNSGQGYGRTSPGRVSQMRYTYKFLNRNGAVAAALVDPNKGNNGAGGGSRENSLPRLDVGLAYRTFNWQIFPSFFVHKADYAAGDSITASGFSVGLKTGSGPMTFTAEFGTGKNWGNTAGSYSGSIAGNRASAAYANGNKLDDSDNSSFFIDVGYRFTGVETNGAVHFVFGEMTSETTGAAGIADTVDATSTMIGVSVPIDLPYIARGFRIRPELFVFDDEDNGSSAVDTTDTILGVQLQYTF